MFLSDEETRHLTPDEADMLKRRALNESRYLWMASSELPPITIDDALPNSGKLSKALLAINGTIADIKKDRSQAKKTVLAVVPTLLTLFTSEKIQQLKECRSVLVRCLQREMDARDKFRAWLRDYATAFAESVEAARGKMASLEETVGEAIVKAGGLENEAKSSINLMMQAHPTHRALKGELASLAAQQSAIDEMAKNNYDRLGIVNAAMLSAIQHVLSSYSLDHMGLFAFAKGKSEAIDLTQPYFRHEQVELLRLDKDYDQIIFDCNTHRIHQIEELHASNVARGRVAEDNSPPALDGDVLPDDGDGAPALEAVAGV